MYIIKNLTVMDDQYGKLNYSESFDTENEVKELKESQEANKKQFDLINSNFQKHKCALCLAFLSVFLSLGLLIYLYLIINNYVLDVESVTKGSVSNAPIGTILAWVPKVSKTSANVLSIPDGWMACDGSVITHGPWTGGKTPELNGIGAFLRGGSEQQVLEMEDDQIQEHEHYCSAATSDHDHGYYAAENNGDEGEFCGQDNGATCDDPDTLTYTEFRTTESAKVSVSCSVKGISSSARSVKETRPKNMKVIYIIRVY